MGHHRPLVFCVRYGLNHGSCGHGSEECTYPDDGHKKDASFAHMMGGSTNRCYSITKWQVGAVDLRNNNSKILSLNKPTVAHSHVIPKAPPDTTATAHYLHPDAFTKLLPHHTNYVRSNSSGGQRKYHQDRFTSHLENVKQTFFQSAIRPRLQRHHQRIPYIHGKTLR